MGLGSLPTFFLYLHYSSEPLLQPVTGLTSGSHGSCFIPRPFHGFAVALVFSSPYYNLVVPHAVSLPYLHPFYFLPSTTKTDPHLYFKEKEEKCTVSYLRTYKHLEIHTYFRYIVFEYQCSGHRHCRSCVHSNKDEYTPNQS